MQKVIVFIFLVLTSNAYAQNITITATVLDENNVPLNGNVILLDTSENMLLGNYFENGIITFTTQHKGIVILKIYSLGFEDFKQNSTQCYRLRI